MKATAKDLRFNTSTLLQTVARGEEVLISFRGKPMARLVPVEAPARERRAPAKLKGFGMWKDREDLGDAVAWTRALRRGRG
jgi:prevent-host-death family protein